MSYILDALKRAQTERELGQVPAMQGALREGGTGDNERGASNSRWRWATGSLVLLLLVAGALWVWQRQSAVPPAFAGAGPPVVAPEARRAPPASDVAAVPTAPPVLPPVLPAAPTVAEPAPAASPTLVIPIPTPTPAPIAPTQTTPPAQPPAPTRVQPAASTNLAVIALESLDAPTRARLPRLSLGGAIHANERAQRMVILDGQVLREGDSVLPGVTVDTIDPQGVLLRLDERFGPPRRVRISG